MIYVDVVICGGGPVGLLIAYCLARYGVQAYVVEQHDKVKQSMYGRAALIAPRSLEMLDQLDLADALGQIGFVTRGQKFYRDGKIVDRISGPTSDITDTFFDYCLLCRQRYTEAAMSEAYTTCSKNAFPNEIFYGHKLVDMSVADDTSAYPHPVTATISTANGQERAVRCKYLIGADGGSSTVRSLAGIPFPGDRNERYWVRIDGRVRTNMPDPRSGLSGLDSPTHGSILWACLDHGTTRVGFALPPAVWAAHGRGITQESVIAEAKKAVRPFSLEFEDVEWWTVYSVGQRLADTYSGIKERIFLAGDAAHTHSSAAAQGMNTGLHDAVNLAWKLAGYIRGSFTAEVLRSYESERRPVAEKVIAQDRRLAVLTGGEVPKDLRHEGKDAAALVLEIYKSNVELNTGLGIQYPLDGILNVASTTAHVTFCSIPPGSRCPDVLVQRPGPRVPLRLHSLMKNEAVRFCILVFAGDPAHTAPGLESLRECLGDDPAAVSGGGGRTTGGETTRSFLRRYDHALFRFLTVLRTANGNGAAEEKLGGRGFGTVVFDIDGGAHGRYGVLAEEGAVVVVRPDGVVGMVARLGEGEVVGRYFGRFLVEKGERVGVDDGERKDGNGDLGDEMDGERVAMGEVDVEVDGGKGERGDTRGCCK